MKVTYERNSAVPAGSNLGLIGVDEDLGVTQRTTASITADDPLVCPANGLFVDEFNSGQRRRLDICQSF